MLKKERNFECRKKNQLLYQPISRIDLWNGCKFLWYWIGYISMNLSSLIYRRPLYWYRYYRCTDTCAESLISIESWTLVSAITHQLIENIISQVIITIWNTFWIQTFLNLHFVLYFDQRWQLSSHVFTALQLQVPFTT